MKKTIARSLWIASFIAGAVGAGFAPAFAQPGAQPGAGEPSAPGTPPTTQPAAPGQPAPPPVTGTVIRPNKQPARPLTAEEAEVLADVEAEFVRFADTAEKHQQRVSAVISREYNRRVTTVETKYATRLSEAESARGTRHGATTALLEKFLVEHPNHAQFTPDAMFRLADLYLDASNDELDRRLDINPDDPNSIADYSRSLALWEDILTRFPDYRQTPSTLYLLAYFGRSLDERRSLQIFLALTCANRYKWNDAPPATVSLEEAKARAAKRELRDPYATCEAYPGADLELVRHGWVRGIADHHFSTQGEIDDGIAAYLKVADGGKDSSLYAEALYKLAWSYYRRDYLLESIQRFDESVKLYDSIIAEGANPALELRDESVQYIAVAFTDPWPGEAQTDTLKAYERAKDFYKGRENEPHVRDVWVAMGRAFMELQAYTEAIDSFRFAIGSPWELNPQNPQVHQEIVNAYEATGDKFAADGAAAELALRYAPGSAWYLANEKDREAMDNQRRIAERALYAAARNTHAAATNMRREWLEAGSKEPQIREDFIELYGKAIGLYQTFIQQYPESDYVYEFMFLIGEGMYFSERYMEAVGQYKWVRDHRDLSEKFYLDAAKGVLASYESEAQKQVDAGQIAALKVLTAAELKAMPQPLSPQPIPAVYQDLQREWDEYQNVVVDPKSAPIQGINAALVSQSYLHIDDAIARFQKVMDKFCGNESAVKAKDGLLSIYEATGRLDEFEATNRKFIETKCGDAKAIELALSQNRSIEFRRAVEMSRAGNYIAAAEAFYKYHKAAPVTDADMVPALYNSAVNYRLGDRPKTAISLFKEFTGSKEKAFRESPFFIEAMRQTALAYQGAYDYKTAITLHLETYAVAKSAKSRGIKPPEPIPGEPTLTFDEMAMEALYNAAFVAELNREAKRAVELYAKYEKEETKRRDKDRAQWAIARIYRSTGSVNEMIAALDSWRKKYGNDDGNQDDFIASYYDTAKLYQKKGRTTQANEQGALTVEAWRKKGAVKGTRGATLAAEWQWATVDRYFTGTFEPYRITKRPKTDKEAKALKEALDKVSKDMQDRLLTMDQFGAAEYLMASKVRFGETLVGYATKLADMPTPQYVLDLDKRNPDAGAVAAYEEALGRNLKRFADQAKTYWSEVVDLAKTNGVSNRWSQRALENLAREFPDDFSVLHQELFNGTEAP